MTVKELIEELKKFPEDYQIELRIKYQEVGDFGDGWSNMWTDDIEALNADNEKKKVTIKAWQ